MELSNFLDKYHSRADKMRILQKMLKAAEANKKKVVSVKKARSIIFNHKEGDMKIQSLGPGPARARPNKKKKKPLDQKYREWEKWLDECPVDWTSSRHPTSFIETVNFDFTKYESEDE